MAAPHILAPSHTPDALSPAFVSQPRVQQQWTGFVRRLRVSGFDAPDDLAEVTELIIVFIMPVATAVAADIGFTSTWVPGKGWD